MSAVPKKKLCWNCDGNISIEIDNCPYCGVYLHAAEAEDDSSWNPSYNPSKTEEIPSPLYQVHPEQNDESQIQDYPFDETADESFRWSVLMTQLKRDVFPLLFLMMGSVFFLFGIVLVLFAQNGTLTLQWQGHDGFYFLLLALPLVAFGWKFLQQLDTHDQ